uniref:Alpha-galactosidase n=1 Tax=Aceria tosichella TaxID=561515 RepID=A0A6G1S5T5_9ACAR
MSPLAGKSRLLAVAAVLVCLASFQASTSLVAGLDNGLARTPPMGWLSWERFTCITDCTQYPDDCINSRLYKIMADRLVAEGYAELGYEYVNIDDCWSERERDAESGNLLANASRFPEGINGLAEYVHSRGLKLGIYGDCGTKTCAGYPAQLKSESDLEDNYFQLDAERLASWQVDSFKFDGCNLDPSKAESICPNMAKAIEANKRAMVVICEWPFYMLRERYSLLSDQAPIPDFSLAQRACNAWRYYEDIEDSWLSVLSVIDFTVRIQETILKYHGPGHWFDPDQLVVGDFALSLDQARAQMAIWCIWSAPLYMSNDLRQIEPDMAKVLKNRHLIEVDQDPMGVFGMMVANQHAGKFQAFVKPVLPIRSGCPSFVVVYLNRETLGNSRVFGFKLRDLLAKVNYDLVAERYNTLYSSSAGDSSNSVATEGAPPKLGAPLIGNKCKSFIHLAMTKDPSAGELLNKPVGANPEQSEPKLEEKQVYFQVVDLFDDEPSPRPVALNGQLNLKVNLSGVRAVKLIQV